MEKATVSNAETVAELDRKMLAVIDHNIIAFNDIFDNYEPDSRKLKLTEYEYTRHSVSRWYSVVYYNIWSSGDRLSPSNIRQFDLRIEDDVKQLECFFYDKIDGKLL